MIAHLSSVRNIRNRTDGGRADGDRREDGGNSDRDDGSGETHLCRKKAEEIYKLSWSNAGE